MGVLGSIPRSPTLAMCSTGTPSASVCAAGVRRSSATGGETEQYYHKPGISYIKCYKILLEKTVLDKIWEALAGVRDETNLLRKRRFCSHAYRAAVWRSRHEFIDVYAE